MFKLRTDMRNQASGKHSPNECHPRPILFHERYRRRSNLHGLRNQRAGTDVNVNWIYEMKYM